jgi:NAD(P)-dependent dehydrogenase (short-subunit alcohol dehydrogenase family)
MIASSNRPICALVGVGPGIGISLARKFGHEGCELALIARGADVLAENVAALNSDGIAAQAFPADVTNPDSLDRAFVAINESLGAPAILLYNATVVTRLPPSELPVDTFMRDLANNVAGALAAVQRITPGMRAAGGGTILFSSAGVGVEPEPNWASYGASKAALRNLAFSIGGELGSDSIHVAVITIAGRIVPGTNLDPDRLAAEYWRLHSQKKDDWERELVVR